MPRWVFAEDVLLDRDGTAHRLSCRLAPASDDATPVYAGEEITVSRAPAECWTCRPQMISRLGPPDEDRPPRNLDCERPKPV